MAADRPAESDRVAGLQFAREERRHVAVVEAVDGELRAGRLGRGGDRIAALGAVAVPGRQAHVGVPARCPGHWGTAKRMVFTRGVSSRIETTVAACQPVGLGGLIAVIPLLPPPGGQSPPNEEAGGTEG